jgi:hypothetical protein
VATWARAGCLRDARAVGARYRVDGANGKGGVRQALQPSALFECRKFNSRWYIPSTRAIAGAKLQSDLLVAIRNP